MRAAKDMQNYRRGYPNLTDDDVSDEKMINLNFYLNKFPSSPDEIYIESFHKEWKTDYKRLERVHSYIQWLFPLREPGVNYMASELTKKEILAFRESEEAKKRLVESYELMLGFYGIQLVNKETGEVKRADNWRERFANLEKNMHNNLRITRILKSLGELGFEHYQSPLVHFFLEETLVKRTLSSVKRSVLDYFLFAVRDKKDRRGLLRYAFQHFEPKDKFVWCPRKMLKQLAKPEKANGEGSEDVRPILAKAREEEPAGTQKEKTPDSDEHAEGSTVGPVDSEQPKNGNANDTDVDMDDSGKRDPSAEEGLQQDSQANNNSVSDTVEAGTNVSEMERPTTKKTVDREVPGGAPAAGKDTVVSNNSPSKQTSPSATTSSKSKADDPKKISHKKDLSKKGLPPDTVERAEKFPRTEYSNVDKGGEKGVERTREEQMDVGSTQPSSD
ncbi:opioid growth factor receptor isoform X2 [Esox lucius]|nr:opioid growth factor receptor isoform X2 [Esox lucius]XP_019906937.2 opioid growth factor receptor isoform X2 [Esox lucius]